MKSIISAENLNVGYDKKTVVENVNIKGMKGQLICLLGPNGAGKTTILRTISGLLAPLEGIVYITEQDVCQLSKELLAKKLAVVLTEQMSLGFLTVFEIATMGRYPHTNHFGKLSEADIKVVYAALTDVDAYDLRDRYFSELSDGEKQKVMIARALVQEPQLIVLDEPTSHLDVRHKVEVIKILQRLCEEKGITVILSLHDIDLAMKACQTVLLIRHGKVVAQGMPEEIITDGTIQKLYDIEGAFYSELMGSLEFHNVREPEIFVTGGSGTGAGVYRALSRAGLGMACGILHGNDVDAFIGKSLNCRVIEEAPFIDIGVKKYQEACRFAEKVKIIIDTNFPLGDINKLNLELIKEAIKRGQQVYTLCPDAQLKARYGELSDKVIDCNCIGMLIQLITDEKERKHVNAH